MNWLWIALAVVAWRLAPNVTSGALIGMFGGSWVEVLGAACAWPLVWCLYVGVFARKFLELRAANLNPNRARYRNWPPMLVMYWIEFMTALNTALPIACVVYLVRVAT